MKYVVRTFSQQNPTEPMEDRPVVYVADSLGALFRWATAQGVRPSSGGDAAYLISDDLSRVYIVQEKENPPG